MYVILFSECRYICLCIVSTVGTVGVDQYISELLCMVRREATACIYRWEVPGEDARCLPHYAGLYCGTATNIPNGRISHQIRSSVTLVHPHQSVWAQSFSPVPMARWPSLP
jgi:hypothetical protein